MSNSIGDRDNAAKYEGGPTDSYVKWHRLMMLMILIYGLFSLFVGEKVQAGGGFGWDGVMYADIVKNLPSLISNGQMTTYYAQRILPSLLVRVGLLVLGLDFSNINIIRGFVVLDFAALLVSAAVWRAISDHLRFGLNARWLGFGAILVNFFATKQTEFYPVLTDATALLIAMLFVLCYLKQRPFALLLSAIAGSFVWQVMGLCGALLIAFLKVRIPCSDAAAARPWIGAHNRRKLLVAWICFLMICIASYIVMETVIPPEALGFARIHKLDRLVTGLPSLVAAGAAIIVVLGSPRQVVGMVKSVVSLNLKFCVLALLCIAIPQLIVDYIANRTLANPNGFSQVLEWVVFPIGDAGRFLTPLVGVAVFWGPAFLLMILLWPKVAAELRRLGPGPMAVVCLHIPLGLVTEPRYLLAGWPFAVTALILALERVGPGRSLMYAFGVLSLLASQFWLRINYRPWTGSDYENLREFPKQLYFMHYGPWMSWTTFLAQLALVLLGALWLRRSLHKRRE